MYQVWWQVMRPGRPLVLPPAATHSRFSARAASRCCQWVTAETPACCGAAAAAVALETAGWTARAEAAEWRGLQDLCARTCCLQAPARFLPPPLQLLLLKVCLQQLVVAAGPAAAAAVAAVWQHRH